MNPFALLCGLLSVTMLATHGAAWLALKTDGAVAAWARSVGLITALLTPALFALAGLALFLWVDGYHLASEAVSDAPSNPLLKTVASAPALWFTNYHSYPFLLVAPVLGLVGPLLVWAGLKAHREGLTLIMSGLSIFGIIATVGVSMFPIILPGSIAPVSSLTVWDSSSSHQTLFIMLAVTVIFLPIVLAYTAWVYRILWGKVDVEAIRQGNGHHYLRVIGCSGFVQPWNFDNQNWTCFRSIAE